MDVHVPRAITLGLRLRGVDVLTSQEDQTATMSDVELLQRATDLGRILYSEDSDLLVEAAHRQELGLEFVGVIYCHQTRLTIGRRVADLELIAVYGEAEEFRNLVVFLPLH
jgi:Domain of unknown function (DUF5615)